VALIDAATDGQLFQHREETYNGTSIPEILESFSYGLEVGQALQAVVDVNSITGQATATVSFSKLLANQI